MSADTRPLPIAVLISGGGTTLRNLIERQSQGLPIDIRLVVSSSAAAPGLEFAKQAGIPTRVVNPDDSPSREAFRDSVFQPCREATVDYVVMGGFIKHVLIPDDFTNRVINIHPSLIPSFCGKGFYGIRVHRAVLEYGAKISGCTVHFVDDEYDHGPIIRQETVPVSHQDTPKDLAKRVFERECQALPTVLHQLAEGRVQLEGRRVHVTPS